jgi:glutamate synthase domain-containing protein 3
LTGSAFADQVIQHWASEAKNFRKVMPRDYKKVLTVMEAARAEGLNESDTAQRIMEAARG